MTIGHGLRRIVRGERARTVFVCLALSVSGLFQQAYAVDGTWNPPGGGGAASGLWGTSTNWTGGNVANGASAIADFSTLNLTATATVSLDSSRTIGQLKFQDATTSSNPWILDNNANAANVLTLNNGASQPVIDVLNQNVNISLNLAGTNGFRKIDAGALILSGNNGGLSGQVFLGRGDINVQTGSTTALGTGAIVIDPQANNARIVLNSGVTLANPITMTTSNSGGGANGTIITNGAFDATVSGNITINGVATSGGHWAGSTGTNYLNILGSVTNSLPANFVAGGAGNGIVIRSGNTRMSGGGSSFRIDNRAGILAAGANNGIPTNAVLNLGGNGNGTLDLNGFNQTLAAVSNFIGAFTNTVTNTSATPSTLTLAPLASNFSVSDYTNISFSGTITDSGVAPLNIVINGDATGSQTFSNMSNTYNGSTTLTSGTLAVTGLSFGGSPSSIGQSSFAASNLVFNGGALRYTGATTSTDRNFTINSGRTATIDVSTASTELTFFGGSAASNGGLTKAGNGTLILSGNNSHTGATTVSAGKLLVDGSLAVGSAVSVASGATLGGTGTVAGTVTPSAGGIIAPGASVGTLNVGKLSLATGSIMNFEFGFGVNDQITVNDAAGLTVNGGSINLLVEGTTNPFSTNSVTPYTLFNYNGGFSGALTNLSIANAQPGKFYSLSSNGSAVLLAIGDATTINWNGSTSTSWTTGGNWVGGSSPNSVGTSVRFNGSNLSGSSNTTVTVDGTGKTTSGIIFNDDFSGTAFTITGAQTLTLDNGVAATAVNVSGGNQTISAPLQLNGAATISTTNGGSLTVSSNISGARPMTFAGDSVANLTGTNAYTTTNLKGGTLNVGTGGAGGTLGTGNVTMSTGTNLNFNRSTAYNFASGITGTVGTGDISKAGSGALTISGPIDQVGAINVNGGSLTTSSTINQAGGISMSNAASMTASGALSGAGGITMDSTGTLTLGASNSYAGTTTINNGSTVLNAAGALPNSAVLAVNGGTLNLNDKNITLSNIQDATTSTGVITNNGTGTSTITFAGFEANYDIYAQLKDGAGGGKVALNSSIDNTVGGAIRVLHIHSPGTYSGGTTVSKQSIQADVTNAFGTGPINVALNNSSINSSQILLAGGVTIPNNITIAQANPLAGNGVIQQVAATAGNTTLNGTITIQADNLNGGLFVGPATAGTDYMIVNGAVNVSGTATTIAQREGNVRYSGGGNYPIFQATGRTQLGANNGLSQSAVIQIGVSGNGIFDLGGFNQTAVALFADTVNTSTVENTGAGFNTLTLNTSGTNSFNGTINGNINLTVAGNGTQTITGDTAYAGNTNVKGGTLSFEPISGSSNFADSADILVASGAFLNLGYFGQDTIRYLYLNGTPMAPGVYNAGNGLGRLTGTGELLVSMLGPALGIAGDYNNNGVVDAADYAVWRKNQGTSNILPNDPTGGMIGATQYNTWKANFGKTPGSSSALADSANVPEPGTIVLGLLSLCGAAAVSRRRMS